MIEIWAMNSTGMEWIVATAHNAFVANVIVEALEKADPGITFSAFTEIEGEK